MRLGTGDITGWTCKPFAMTEQQVMELVESVEASPSGIAAARPSGGAVIACHALGFPRMTDAEARTITETLKRRGYNVTVFTPTWPGELELWT